MFIAIITSADGLIGTKSVKFFSKKLYDKRLGLK